MKRLAFVLLLLLVPLAWADTKSDSQVSCTSAGGVVVGTASGRKSLTVTNPSASVTVYMGATGANTEYGILPNNSVTWNEGTSAAYVYKCYAASTVTVSIHEVFGVR